MLLAGLDNSKYLKQAENIRNAWRNKFLNDEKLSAFQTYHAVAIYFGLLEPDEIKKHSKMLADLVIANGYHIDCGIIGTKCIFNALCENGYCDVVYKMVTNPTMPSYAYWINNGMTTLCETWDMSSSCNHHMFSEVDNWLYRYVAGICIGYNGVIIKPQYINTIEYVKANVGELKIERNKNTCKIFAPHEVKLVLNDEMKILSAGEHIILLSTEKEI